MGSNGTSLAILNESDRRIVQGRFKITPTGLVIDGNPTYDEWYDFGSRLQKYDGAIQWAIGDWLNEGERRYGETYTQAIKETDGQYQALADYKWVAGRVEFSFRYENLSWTHHRQVAKFPPAEQKLWLHKAEKEEWSVSDLRAAIKRQSRIDRVRDNGTLESNVTVLQGDMLDIVPTLGKFALIVADPPYNVTDWSWDVIGGRDEFISLTRQWLGVLIPALEDQYNLFWFCSPVFASDIEMVMRDLDMPIQSRIVWHRRNMAMGSKAKNKFIDSWEMIFHCGTRELNFPSEWSDAWFDVQTFAVPQTNFEDAKVHPTQKPLDLIMRLVEFGSYPGDRILDPFAGSGTTGRAGAGRECVLIERESEYIELMRGMF